MGLAFAETVYLCTFTLYCSLSTDKLKNFFATKMKERDRENEIIVWKKNIASRNLKGYKTHTAYLTELLHRVCTIKHSIMFVQFIHFWSFCAGTAEYAWIHTFVYTAPTLTNVPYSTLWLSKNYGIKVFNYMKRKCW